MVANLSLGQRASAWKEFVGSQKISISIDPPIISSWKRCWGLINPYQAIRLNPLHSDHLLSAQVANFDLISVARPVMEDIYQYLEDNSIAVVLTNNAGCVLDLLGDTDILEFLKTRGIETGAFLSESQVGTNSFALALLDRVPIQVIGAEHYLEQLQDLTEAAAPVFELSGRPLGSFGLFTFAGRYNPTLLSLAVAGARAVEGQLMSDQLLQEQNQHLAVSNAIVNSISNGVMVWDANQTLMYANNTAAKTLGFPAEALLGRKAGALISYPKFVVSALERMEPLTDVKARVLFNGRPYDCILSLRFVENDNRLQWVIVSYRPDSNSTSNSPEPALIQPSNHLEELVCESSEMRKVRRMAKSATAATASVLICGESGCGKTALARAIHDDSPRQERPFLLFPCASIPRSEQIPELLGFEEGVSSRKQGAQMSKFELAQGGTLFFQDIEALSLEAQGILLNFLEVGVIYRLGSGRPIPADVRVIASTAAPIKQLIAEHSFRSDLYYRISPFEINLPPLRNRDQDVPLLVKRITTRLSQQLHRNINVSPEVMRLFLRYSWPGNLRELDSVICRAAGRLGILENIQPEHLPDSIQKPVRVYPPNPQPLEITSLIKIEENMILEAAAACRGNISEMARILGIGRTTVWRKLKEYNIQIQDYRQASLQGEEAV